jgi:hypothetical protein
VLVLHAWGDALAGSLGQRVESWQYPEIRQAPFVIRAPRRSLAVEFAPQALRDFVASSVQAYGARLDLRAPAEPVPVILLDAPDGDRRRYGGDAAEFLEKHEGLFDPSRRAIIVRMDSKIDQGLVTAALRRAGARLLLFDAGSPRWSPWLAEGLVGVLEGAKAAEPRPRAGDLPTLQNLLSAREADFRGKDGPAYRRGARLLTTYLMETMPKEFDAYYQTVRAEGAVPLPQVIDRFIDPVHEDVRWKEWLQVQK